MEANSKTDVLRKIVKQLRSEYKSKKGTLVGKRFNLYHVKITEE